LQPLEDMNSRALDASTGAESPAADNIRAIVELQRRAARRQTVSERFSHRISQFAGSLTFVVMHLCWFAGWAGWNALAPSGWRFDPYPYGLLTFIVSMEGVLIATFVLITQNRMSRQSDERDHLTLQVDLLSEQEMTIMLRMLRRISEHLGIPPETAEAARAEKLTEDTNVFDLVRTLQRELPDDSGQ
jgi:uncharacterized membrane protein